jgi:NADH-quinone oxidoreductase subunit J
MSFIGFVISAFAIASALGVVVLRNPLFSAFSLIVNLLAMAGLYAVMGAHFLAVTQVVVYAGAIMVLVLFVLMLLNLKAESGRKIGFFRSLLAVGIGALIFMSVALPMLAQFSDLSPITLAENMKSSEGTVKAVGEALYGRYMVQFELSSLVLLIGIVGAIMLAKRKAVTLAPRAEGMGGK